MNHMNFLMFRFEDDYILTYWQVELQTPENAVHFFLGYIKIKM